MEQALAVAGDKPSAPRETAMQRNNEVLGSHLRREGKVRS